MFTVPLGWTRVGRSRSCALLLEDRSVSRRHALLIRTAGDEGLRVIDDRSLFGTFVNDEQVRWAVLGDGDRVRIGCFELTVGLGAPAVPELSTTS
jgi:pSer/pThr/pTyr-binding forkhead associated (FHA) protein